MNILLNQDKPFYNKDVYEKMIETGHCSPAKSSLNWITVHFWILDGQNEAEKKNLWWTEQSLTQKWAIDSIFFHANFFFLHHEGHFRPKMSTNCCHYEQIDCGQFPANLWKCIHLQCSYHFQHEADLSSSFYTTMANIFLFDAHVTTSSIPAFKSMKEKNENCVWKMPSNLFGCIWSESVDNKRWVSTPTPPPSPHHTHTRRYRQADERSLSI